MYWHIINVYLRKTFLSLDVVESTNANLFLSRDEKSFIYEKRKINSIFLVFVQAFIEWSMIKDARTHAHANTHHVV